MDHAAAVFDSPYGQIISTWVRENGHIDYCFVVPANTTAEVILPEKAMKAAGIKADKSGRYIVGPGEYCVTVSE